MTQVTVNLTDTFEDWRVKTNQICANQGDIATLTTTTQVSLVAAINEIDATSGMGSIVEDTSPQLGNDLDVQTYDIVSTANRPITITPNGSGDVILDGLKYPQADGSANQFLKTDGNAQLSFATVGTTWESKSADFTAEAGKAYFCDTSSNDIDVTLPTGSIGDTIRFLDVSGTFDTNDLTVLYGSSKIQGASANLDVATERAGFALVYYNSTQGWLLTEK